MKPCSSSFIVSFPFISQMKQNYKATNFSKWSNNSISLTWKLVRNADSQAPPWTC